MIPEEVLKKVRQIEVLTRDLVNTIFSGEYHTAFKGQGMEFQEVREYQPGDEVRSIDWNVTARMRAPFVKVFTEEREQILMLVVDASGSGNFGTRSRMKGELAVELAAILAFSAIKNNDRVGLIIFTDRIEKFVPPEKGRSHVLRVIRELLYFKPQGRGTSISTALEFLNKVTRRKAIVLLVSDFLDTGFDRALKVARRKHDLIALSIVDPREQDLPDVGRIELEDAETGEVLMVNTSDVTFRKAFRSDAQHRGALLKKKLSSLKVDHIELSTDRPYTVPLMKFFKQRARMVGR